MMNIASLRITSGVNSVVPPTSSIGEIMNSTPPAKPSSCRHSAIRERSW
jgi:hypothetical protein